MYVAAVEWDSVLLGAGISALIALLIGAIWTQSLGLFLKWFNRHGEIRGEWYAILSAYQQEGERIDRVKLHQRGQRIFGDIRRIRPATQDERWHFAGYMHGNVVVCVFYTTRPKVDPTSYGVISLHRDPQKPESLYRGYYTRPDFAAFTEFIDEGIARRPIVWQREHPDKQRYS